MTIEIYTNVYRTYNSMAISYVVFDGNDYDRYGYHINSIDLNSTHTLALQHTPNAIIYTNLQDIDTYLINNYTIRNTHINHEKNDFALQVATWFCNYTPKTRPNIYFNVSYNDKEYAKKCGAKYHNIKKLWYSNNVLTMLSLIKHFSIYKPITELKGEDRTFSGNELFIDLIPTTSWFNNARSATSQSEWQRVRKHVYERVDNICETCGGPPSHNRKTLDCHERWDYNYSTSTQKLMRLVALCKSCHDTTHYGLSVGVQKRDEEIKNHMKKVRGFTDEEYNRHIEEAYNKWNQRNRIKWKLDLSLLSNNGVEL
jgi:hypothetical protein